MTRISKFYGIPKLHKPNHPLRPIISNTNCNTYKLSTWLSNILKTLLGNISPAHIKNTPDFIQKTHQLNPTTHQFLSFDVKSLFTSVPVDHTLQLLEEYITNNNIILPY